MSRVLITGAGGFIGTALLEQLRRTGQHQFTLIDQQFTSATPLPDQRQLTGSFGDPALLEQAFQNPIDIAFHLASIPGSAAEANPVLGTQVNLLDTQSLFQRLALNRAESDAPVRVVFASTIAVYGAIAQEPCTEDLAPMPTISYGAHKLMNEIFLADLTRRVQLDGRSVRLPGIVARPIAPLNAPSKAPHNAPSGFGSAFMSDLIRYLASGTPYTCPVSKEATAWWMSRPCCVDNLIHAAALKPQGLPASRVWQLPVLYASIEQIVQTLADRYGADRAKLIDYQPNQKIQALFGALPPLATPRALAHGFRHDGHLDTLILKSLQ